MVFKKKKVKKMFTSKRTTLALDRQTGSTVAIPLKNIRSAKKEKLKTDKRKKRFVIPDF